MTWAEAVRKGRARWLMWIAIGSALACGFLIKGGTDSELPWAVVIGAVNGTAVGFAVGPAAEKGAMILSGLLAGTPFYFIGSCIFVMESMEAQKSHRGLLSDVIPLVSTFLGVGIVFSLAQALRVRNRVRQRSVGGIPLLVGLALIAAKVLLPSYSTTPLGLTRARPQIRLDDDAFDYWTIHVGPSQASPVPR
jgi:hypothetical protein